MPVVPFAPKNWKNEIEGAAYTAISAEALEEMETRLAAYTDSEARVVYEAPLNLEYRGAALDGTTDDSAVWQAAANAIPAAGGEIFQPPGVSIAANVKLKSRTRVFGVEGASILKLKTNAGAINQGPYATHRTILTNADTDTTGNTDIYIEGMEFDGNHTGNSSTDCFPVRFCGVQRLTVRNCYIHDCGRSGILIHINPQSFIQNEDVTLDGIRLYNLGLVGSGWGAIGIISCDRLYAHNLQCRKSADYVIDLEPNNDSAVASQGFHNCIIDGVEGYNVGQGVVVNCIPTSAGCHDAIIRNVTLKDGPDYALARFVRLTGADRTILSAASSEYPPNSEAVLLEDCADTIISKVKSIGAYTGSAGPAIKVTDSNRTLVTACALTDSGGQTYAVEETGSTGTTFVQGNQELGGGVLLIAANSFIGQNGPDEAWVTPTLAGTWADAGGGYPTTQYMKDSLGWVHLKGRLATGNAAASTIFTLPSTGGPDGRGYRPSKELDFPIIANGALGQLTIQAGGIVQFAVGTATNVLLNGVSFRMG